MDQKKLPCRFTLGYGKAPADLEKKDYQKLGRWSSNAFECYLKENRAERKWEMEKIHRHLIDHNFV